MNSLSKSIAALSLLIAASACTSVEPVSGTPSASANFDVTAINVVVPSTLSVSEKNSIKPAADIVWHEEVVGDRYAQVKTIVSEGLQVGADRLHGSQDVILDVQVTRFHAQTNRVRYSYGGEHEVEFYLTVRDAATGAILADTHKVDATFPAYGGEDALAADRAGITQKSRIVERLSNVVVNELNKI
jgi:hypothetical protein